MALSRLRATMSTQIDKEIIKLKIDLQEGTQQSITLKQSDHNSRLLKVILTKNGLPMSLYNSRVSLYIRKSNGEIVSIEGYDMTENSGEVYFSLTRQALSTLPSVECEVVKIGNDESVLSFPIFTISIKDSIHDEVYDLIEQDEVGIASTEDWGF